MIRLRRASVSGSKALEHDADGAALIGRKVVGNGLWRIGDAVVCALSGIEQVDGGFGDVPSDVAVV